jgi:hypothetical protein
VFVTNLNSTTWVFARRSCFLFCFLMLQWWELLCNYLE